MGWLSKAWNRNKKHVVGITSVIPGLSAVSSGLKMIPTSSGKNKSKAKPNSAVHDDVDNPGTVGTRTYKVGNRVLVQN